MRDLVDEAGRYRSGGIGIFRGKQRVQMAPPAGRVPRLMADLLDWLEYTNEHPLVASCIFHYEFEFIHPFADGNGRMGRLWQTLILRNWKPLVAYVPVEAVIRDRQEDCCRVLAVADSQADATPFVAFMLCALRDAVREAVSTDQAGDPVTAQVAAMIRAIGSGELGSNDLMQALGLSHRPTFRNNHLNPTMEDGWIERTQPDSPRSPTQRYRLTGKGHRWLQHHDEQQRNASDKLATWLVTTSTATAQMDVAQEKNAPPKRGKEGGVLEMEELVVYFSMGRTPKSTVPFSVPIWRRITP